MVMTRIAGFQNALWAATMLLASGLAALVVLRKNHKAYPLFFAYIVAALLQNLAFVFSYRIWGFGSAVSFKIAWGTQSVVVVARALAVAEISRHVLARYRGIWALGWRIFLAVAALVFIYSWAVGRHSWQLVALTADRSLELAMAAAILGIFSFVRYYEVAIELAPRLLAIGFFLYSCFRVLNDTILERWLGQYTTLWNLLGTASFLVSLTLWSWALRQTQPQATTGPELLAEGFYWKVAPEINSQLRALNEQLGRFWHTEGKST